MNMLSQVLRMKTLRYTCLRWLNFCVGKSGLNLVVLLSLQMEGWFTLSRALHS
nr:hypothetical protein Iba_chr06bCG2010 [Ipomoea batatas]